MIIDGLSGSNCWYNEDITWLVTELAYAEVFQIEDGSRLGHRRRGYVALSGARFNKREAVIEVILLPSRLQDPFKVDPAVTNNPHWDHQIELTIGSDGC